MDNFGRDDTYRLATSEEFHPDKFLKEEDSSGIKGYLEANLKLEVSEGDTQTTINKDKHDSSAKNIAATAILITLPPSTPPAKGLSNTLPSKYDLEGLLITPRSSIVDNKRASNRAENTESVSQSRRNRKFTPKTTISTIQQDSTRRRAGTGIIHLVLRCQ